MKRQIASIALLLCVLTVTVRAQTVRLGAGGGLGPIDFIVDNIVRLRIDKDGNISAMNGAAFLVEGLTGSSGRVPYYDTSGRLTSSAGMVFTSSNGSLNVTGQSTGTGSVRSTSMVTSDGAIRAAFFAKRNGGTVAAPSSIAGDGAEYLVQVPDTNGNYANVGGFMCRTLDSSPAVMTGRCEIATKPAGTYDTTFDYTRMVFEHNGNVGIGWYFGNSTLAASPASVLHVARDATDPAGASTAVLAERASADATGPAFVLRKNRGSLITKTKATSGDSLGQVLWQGYQETTSNVVSAASISVNTTQDFSSTAGGSIMSINVAGTDSVTATARVTVSGAGLQGTGTGLSVANVGANSCGSAGASIAGFVNSGEVTVGTGGGTQCRITIPQAVTTRINGACVNTTTNQACRLVGVTTSTFDLVGTFTASDVISFITIPR